jgi:hypothetical protein
MLGSTRNHKSRLRWAAHVITKQITLGSTRNHKADYVGQHT